MKSIFTLKKLLVLLLAVVLCGCSASGSTGSSEGVLDKDTTYLGKNATKEIIEVDSGNTWTIKSENEDDTNYTVVSVEVTDEMIGDFPVVKLVAEEVNGDISSSFAKREGRSYIIAKDGDEVFFRSIAEENKESISSEMETVNDQNEYVKEIANFKFSK